MTQHWRLGLGAVVVIGGVVIFTFRQGFKVKPDRNNKKFGGMPPGSIGPE